MKYLALLIGGILALIVITVLLIALLQKTYYSADETSSSQTVTPPTDHTNTVEGSRSATQLQAEIPDTTASSTTATMTTDLPYQRVVVYDKNGFAPERITIVEGGSIEFVNISENTQMHVASNEHPDHAGYPRVSESDCSESSFDQCARVGVNGSWTFSFDASGSWTYHNDANTEHTGVIEVVPVADYLEQH